MQNSYKTQVFMIYFFSMCNIIIIKYYDANVSFLVCFVCMWQQHKKCFYHNTISYNLFVVYFPSQDSTTLSLPYTTAYTTFLCGCQTNLHASVFHVRQLLISNINFYTILQNNDTRHIPYINML